MRRWDRERPATVDNLVLLTFEEAEEHEGMMPNDVRAANLEFFERVQRVFARVRHELGASTEDWSQ